MSAIDSGLSFDSYIPADERRRESLLGLGNGVLFVRGCSCDVFAPDEAHYPGTYRAGCYDRAASVTCGERVEDESLVNLPNWLPLTFRALDDTAWFSLDDVEILEYRHVLELHCGMTQRRVRFRDRAGRVTALNERRLVSMARAHLAGFRLELTPENWDGPLELCSALQLDSRNTLVARYAPFAHRHLALSSCTGEDPDFLVATFRTLQSCTDIAMAVRTRVATPWHDRSVRRSGSTMAEHRVCSVQRGETLAVEKTVAIATSRDVATGNPREAARIAAAEAPDFAALEDEHTRHWALLLRRARIQAEHRALARTMGLHRFQVLQTISPLSVGQDIGFPPRGWQEAYRGQIFWDEIFVFPFLNLRFPEIARCLLLYRYARLEAARRDAARHGLRGAMFPWRSASTGEEVTPAFQFNPLTGGLSRDHTRLQRHVGSAIAYNVWQYFLATGDTAFLAAYGAEMILEIARFWASLARHDPLSDRYDICGVIGPDEYHNAYPGAAEPGLDNNAYTNVMAAWTLCRALEVLDHLPDAHAGDVRQRLHLSDAEFAHWDQVSRKLRLEFHGDGILSQFAGFADLEPIDVAGYVREHPGQRVDWALEQEGGSTDALQLTKQADVLMLLYLLPPKELCTLAARLGYELREDQLRRTAAYYLQRMTHESSLSRVVCAGALAPLDPEASWRYFQQAMRLDLVPSSATGTADGLHLGAMAGTLDVLQRHYLGLRLQPGEIVLRPALPKALGRVRLDFLWRGSAFTLEAAGGEVRMQASR